MVGQWVPGLGPACYGIWTHEWADAEGPLPAQLRSQLEAFPALIAHIEAHQCPYGTALLGDVTWPSPPHGLETIVQPLDLLLFVAVVYSYVPYIVAARVILGCLFGMIIGYPEDVGIVDFGGSLTRSFSGGSATTRPAVVRRRYCGTRQLSVLLWLIFTIVILEGLLKPLCREPRPGSMMQLTTYTGTYSGSCLSSCGMPSSHSALALGWFMLLFLDTIFRVRPLEITGRPAGRELGLNRATFWKQELRNLQEIAMHLWQMGLRPWATKDELTHHEFVSYVSLWFLLMVPVPFMRVVLNDHSVSQVVVGMLVGILLALVWWRLTRWFQRRYYALEDHCLLGTFLVHDHRLPRFEVAKALVPHMQDDLAILEGRWERDEGGEVVILREQGRLILAGVADQWQVQLAPDRDLSLEWVLHGHSEAWGKARGVLRRPDAGAPSDFFTAVPRDAAASAASLRGPSSPQARWPEAATASGFGSLVSHATSAAPDVEEPQLWWSRLNCPDVCVSKWTKKQDSTSLQVRSFLGSFRS